MKNLSALVERNLIPELPINGTLGIPRATMPQIAKEDQSDFFKSLQHDGVRVHTLDMRACDINATQNEINSDKVDAWRMGHKPIVISADNYILDGHHQWAKAMVTDSKMKLKCIKIDLRIVKLLDRARNFKNVEYRDVHESVLARLTRLVGA